MSANDISVPLTIINDIDKEGFGDISDLSSYDIWCDAQESRIHMKGYIPNILEEFKPLMEEENMAHG